MRRAPRDATDRDALAAELAAAVSGEVRFDRGARALYTTDASNYRQVPVGVVVPKTADDVEAAMRIAGRHHTAIFGRGGGTSLAGQTCNHGIAVDFSKSMHHILDIDVEKRRARVQPGVVLDQLRHAVAPHGLTFGPDPSTHQYCTLGGMIGNNSCGVHSVMSQHYGPGPTTAHNVHSLQILTADGARFEAGATDEATFAEVQRRGGRQAEIYRQLRTFQERYADMIRREFPDIPRRVSGYNLPALLPENGFDVGRALVGSESTLCLVLEATVLLIPSMPHRVVVVLGFHDVYAAGDDVPEVMSYKPVGVEGLDDGLARDLRQAGLRPERLELLPEGHAWLLVEFGGATHEDALDQARRFADRIHDARRHPSVKLYEARDDQEQLWAVREAGLAATARVAGRNPTWPGWEDSAVPPERLGAYLRDLRALFDKYKYHADLYGHFGQGLVHCRVDFELRTAPGIAHFRAFMEEAADLVHRYGGSLSGEHGDGQARAELLSRMFSADMLRAFREFKTIWDPDGRMNPGKVVDPYPLDSNLRLGTSYDPPAPATWFSFPEDGGSFAHAVLRCVGVGRCRKTDAGTMCPSYMATREEEHATRGRARLLFEMLKGDALDRGWRAEQVHDALGLCLACKGCKGECPVHVDMATYKAEFLAHHYEHHRRPRSAYAFGRIGTWARLVARLNAQRLVNTVASAPGVSAIAKAAAGMSQDRRIPAFAPETFRERFLRRPPRTRPAGQRVILWPDTFNDHFHPETLDAAVEVLETLGFDVRIPAAPLCCGRPLYDYGMLATAKAHLTRIMSSLDQDIRAGVPIVGLEPGCVSVFRDELVNLFPSSEQAHRLQQQTLTLAELIDRHADGLDGFRLERRAIVHGHCHHKALIHLDADRRVLDRVGVRYDVLDAGCCGMAGAFGFEADHYDVSMAIGERVLLPAVRNAPADTLVLADGFSCREQIAQATDRRALHLAEVLQLAMNQGPQGPPGDRPERAAVADYGSARLTTRELTGAAFVAIGSLAAAQWLKRGRV